MVEDLAREREVVVRDRKIDVRMLVWTLVVGFAVGGEARSIAGCRHAYEAATDQTLVPFSFYDRFTEELATLLPSSSSATSSLLTQLSFGCAGFSRSSKRLMWTSQA